MTIQTAISTDAFVNSIGINTHLDFTGSSYDNVATVEASINFLGLHHIRDSAQTASDVALWQSVAQATGAKFIDYIAEGSPASMSVNLAFVPLLHAQGILEFLCGGNEEDMPYAVNLGNSVAITAAFQQQVFAMGQSLGLPVIAMSFGDGWTAANNWIGNYGTVGDISAFCDFANAHTYPNVGQGTDWAIQRLNDLAHLAAPSRQVMTTEIGWDENQGHTQADVARFALDATLDGMKDGDAKIYFYGLFDDGAGKFGLMNADGSAKPSGQAIHNLTTLLADTGASATTFTPGTLGYTLTGTTASDNSLLMEKSDGTFWLSLWNETDAAHSVTLTLDAAATEIKVFNPLTGVTAIQDVTGVGAVDVALSDSPLVVEIIGGAVINPPPPPPPPPPPGFGVTVPGQETVAPGAKLAITGVSINAALAPGTLALNLSDSGGGIIAIAGQTATSAGGISLTGTLAQLNADLAGLTYTAGAAGTDSITVDVWSQQGIEILQTISVTISGIAPPPPPPPPPPTTTITIGGTDANPVVLDSNVTIKATAGDHMLFIGGTHDVAILTGGTEQVQAYQGGNTITTGAGDDTIRIAGTGNVVDAGSGANMIADSGSGNTFVLGGGVDDIFGYVMQQGATFDFTTALKGTAWDGAVATVGQFLHVATSGNDAIISISPAANGAASVVADLHDSGDVSMSALLARAIL